MKVLEGVTHSVGIGSYQSYLAVTPSSYSNNQSLRHSNWYESGPRIIGATSSFLIGFNFMKYISGTILWHRNIC